MTSLGQLKSIGVSTVEINLRLFLWFMDNWAPDNIGHQDNWAPGNWAPDNWALGQLGTRTTGHQDNWAPDN